MTTPHALVDTAVFAYSQGADHALKRPCQDVLVAAQNQRLRLHASVEMIHELLFHRMRKVDRDLALRQARAAATLCRLHAFDVEILERSFDLIAWHPRIRGRDAVHAATALEHGIETVLSPDPAFDAIPGLTRVDPRDLVSLLD